MLFFRHPYAARDRALANIPPNPAFQTARDLPDVHAAGCKRDKVDTRTDVKRREGAFDCRQCDADFCSFG